MEHSVYASSFLKAHNLQRTSIKLNSLRQNSCVVILQVVLVALELLLLRFGVLTTP